MLLLIAAMVIAEPAPARFPERVPGLIEACLANAVAEGEVSDTEDSHKYICQGETAQRFWIFLEEANVDAHVQDTGEEGRWLTRLFPLGGCFKRVRTADGSPAAEGLSCSIWIPRPRRD
jgi:hypothetical protein